MGILDKLKPQPRWKHADPEVRLEGVRELDDATEIAMLAETDPESRVRLAAIARLSDPAVLGRVLSGDPSDDARERAADRLHALATNGHEASVALAAVRGLTDQRRLSAIAKGDYSDDIRNEALGRTMDARALVAIARHARHASTAAAALTRLEAEPEILDVALTGDHRAVAEAAFETLVARGANIDLLRQIEAKSQQKPVAKLARAAITEIENAEAARLAAEEERRRRESALTSEMTRLAEVTDVAIARSELARLEQAWAEQAVTDENAIASFSAAVADVNAAIARKVKDIEDAVEAERERAEVIATCGALCERVETLDGDDVLAQLEPIEEEWRALMPVVGAGPEADRVAERFALAVAACRKRHELGAVLADAREKLAALVAEAEALPSNPDAAAASARWQALSREARGLTATLSEASRPEADLDQRLAAVADVFTKREAEAQDALAGAQQELHAQLQRLVDRATRVADAENITLREGERLMRDIVAGLDQLGRVTSTRDIEDAARQLRSMQEKVAPRVHELREMDEWRRFANGQQQEKLIAMAQAIVTSLKADKDAGKESDLAATARALRELHAKWQEVAEAPRHSAQRLWEEFRAATDEIRGACEGYFAQMRQERKNNLQAKTSLVEEAEALTQSTDWAKTAARFQELQTAWQSAGPVPRDAGRELGQRFRTACNTFFARRREDLAERKKVWSENLAKKEALCERAEALADSTEWDSASSELKRLQADWKTIGPIRRSKSEQVWNRFRTAADKFFERYHHRHELALAGKLAERDAIVAELEALLKTEGDAVPDGLLDKVRELRTSWNRSVPLPPAEMKPLTERWQAAFATIGQRWPETLKGTDLDPDVIAGKLEKLIGKVEAHLEEEESASQKGLSQAELLAAKLRDALASNTIGGRAGAEAKWRAAADSVKDAQVAWERLAPVAPAAAEKLEPKFKDACRRVLELARRHAGPPKRSGGPKHHAGKRPGGKGQGPGKGSPRGPRRPREVAAV